jgi:acyl carrier protein
MKEKIRDYITNNLLESEVELTYDDDLLNSGLVDSIGVVKLIAYIQEEFAIEVPPEEMVIENFVTINAIDTFLKTIQ